MFATLLVGLCVISPPRVAHAADCTALIARGVGLLDQQSVAEAQKVFLTATRQCPDNAEAQKYLGLTYDQQGRFMEAQQALRKALALNPRDPGTHNDLAVSYYRSGNQDAAVREFQNTIRLDPHNLPANGNLAAYYLSQKKFAPASECLQAVHADESQDLLLLLEATEARFGAGRHREAMATAARLSQLAGSNSQMRFSLGLLLASNNEFELALKQFNSIPESERDAAVYLNLGMLQRNLGRLSEARDSFTQAIRLDPSNPEPYFQTGLNSLKSGKVDEAIYWLGQAHEKDAKRADLTGAFAEALLQAQQFDRARELLALAEQQGTRDPHLLQAIADLHFRTHEDEEALKAYEQCLEVDPRSVEARLGLAHVYQRLHRTAEEKAEYAAVLAVDPQNSGAHAGLGHLALQAGSLDSAATELRAALVHNPNDPQANEDLAVVDQRRGAYDEARTLCAKLVTLDPNNPSYHYELGQALLKLGRKQEAQQEFSRSQELKSAESKKQE